MRALCEFCRCLPPEYDGVHGTDRPGKPLQHGGLRLQPQDVGDLVEYLNVTLAQGTGLLIQSEVFIDPKKIYIKQCSYKLPTAQMIK